MKATATICLYFILSRRFPDSVYMCALCAYGQLVTNAFFNISLHKIYFLIKMTSILSM